MTNEMPLWVQILLAVLSTLITTFLLPYLRALNAKAKAEHEKALADANNATLEAKTELIYQLKTFLFMNAMSIAEQRFPELARKINNKELTTVDEIKAELRSWGKDLKEKALTFFKNQGIDLVAAVGDDYLDDLIRHVADKVSPFPGKETAVELLTNKGTDLIIEKGVEWAKKRLDAELDA